MKPIQYLVGLFFAWGLVTGLAACGDSNAREENGAPAVREIEAISVRVKEIHPAPFVDAITVAGIVKAYDDVFVSPEEGGVVKEWKVRKGQRVAKGDLLVVLRDDVARAGYDAALAQFKIAQMNYEMQEGVYSEKGISEMQFKSMEYNRDAAKAQADLMKARLERTILRSPVAGILSEELFDAGEFAPPAMPIAHVVNSYTLKVSAEVSEKQTAVLLLGTSATITFDAFPGDTVRSKITFIGPAISASNRTLPVEFIIQNPNAKYKPEMIVKVRILRRSRADVILVTEDVVQQVDRGKFVVYVEKDGKAEERIIKIGSRNGTFVEVVEGLKAGERVIVSSVEKLVNGQPVKVQGG